MEEKITEQERLRRDLVAHQLASMAVCPTTKAFFLQLEERWHRLARSTDRKSHAMPDGLARNRNFARADKVIEYKAGFAALHMSACDAVDGPPARLCGGRAAVAPPGMDRGVVLPAPTFGREVLADLLDAV